MSETFDSILNQVARYYGLKPSEITRARRLQPISTVRQVTAFLMDLRGVDRIEIAFGLGLASANSVSHSVCRVHEMLRVENMVAMDVKKLKAGKASGEINFAKHYVGVRRAALRTRHKGKVPESNPRFLNKVGYLSEKREKDYAPDHFTREDGRPGWGALKKLEADLASIGNGVGR